MTMCAVAALVACSGGGASLSPAGWQKLPGATATWVNGTSARRQTYAYSKQRFNGTLQDLAQREIVNDSLRNRGLKFVRSDVFGPCPGLAAIATFAGTGRTLQDAFALQSGDAVVIQYERPTDAHDDHAAVSAMQRALCAAPA